MREGGLDVPTKPKEAGEPRASRCHGRYVTMSWGMDFVSALSERPKVSAADGARPQHTRIAALVVDRLLAGAKVAAALSEVLL